MLAMGNGPHTAATILNHIKTTLQLFDDLGGIQQLGLGPDPYQNIADAQEDYMYRAREHVRSLAIDLGMEDPFKKKGVKDDPTRPD